MLTKSPYSVPDTLLQEAFASLPIIDFKTSINKPTGRFFYDAWGISPEYKNTIWDTILSTLPSDIGEARIIILKPATCYQSHADIDDRYHLTIHSQYSYLVNIDSQILYKTTHDGRWYDFNTSARHSAVNFGVTDRIQLVVRKLLDDNILTHPISIKLSCIDMAADDARFLFDDVVSTWLNNASKQKIISEFRHDNDSAMFHIERAAIPELRNILPTQFIIEEL